MNYEFKIEGADEPKGAIDLQRLAFIAESIRKISEGALQIRLRGISNLKGQEKNLTGKCFKSITYGNKRR